MRSEQDRPFSLVPRLPVHVLPPGTSITPETGGRHEGGNHLALSESRRADVVPRRLAGEAVSEAGEPEPPRSWRRLAGAASQPLLEDRTRRSGRRPPVGRSKCRSWQLRHVVQAQAPSASARGASRWSHGHAEPAT
jgi:hypothetical protein